MLQHVVAFSWFYFCSAALCICLLDTFFLSTLCRMCHNRIMLRLCLCDDADDQSVALLCIAVIIACCTAFLYKNVSQEFYFALNASKFFLFLRGHTCTQKAPQKSKKFHIHKTWHVPVLLTQILFFSLSFYAVPFEFYIYLL